MTIYGLGHKWGNAQVYKLHGAQFCELCGCQRGQIEAQRECGAPRQKRKEQA